ncbi:MAG TPA: N-acetylmuramic acid 6-phosphate etherase [bacterium]
MGRAVRYNRLPTEQPLSASRRLDSLPPRRLLRLMHEQDLRAVRAVGRQLAAVERAVRLISDTLARGGRLLFLGAGTSGRLGVLEAAECPPTFGTRPDQVRALIAGGRGAVFRSREGTEDRREEAARRVRRTAKRGDVVVGIAASGVTPFVDAGLRAAARAGCATILLTCHPKARIPCTVRIPLAVGPELLTGSTRLKAGTATKLALNMLTLGAMVRLGKTYGHLMVDVRPASRKLRARALDIVRTLTGCSRARAGRALRQTRGGVKPAVVMLRLGVTAAEAGRRIALARGSLRRALDT